MAAFNGSGTYVRSYDWTDDRDAGVAIDATRMDEEMDGIATALSNCITKDGQQTVTANIPMGGYKFTGLAAGSANGDSVRYEQVTSAVAITGGTITGITDLAIADGGTGSSTASAAVTALLGGLSGGGFTIAPTTDQVAVRDNSDGTWARFNLNDFMPAALGGIGTTKGNILYHNGTTWVALAPP